MKERLGQCYLDFCFFLLDLTSIGIYYFLNKRFIGYLVFFHLFKIININVRFIIFH